MVSLKRQRSELTGDHTILRGSSHHVHATSESPPRTRKRCASDTLAPETGITDSDRSSNLVLLEEKETHPMQDSVPFSATHCCKCF